MSAGAANSAAIPEEVSNDQFSLRSRSMEHGVLPQHSRWYVSVPMRINQYPVLELHLIILSFLSLSFSPMISMRNTRRHQETSKYKQLSTDQGIGQ